MATNVPVNTGRWTEEEHAAFEEGLRLHGTNWRAVQRLIPSRTLVQIRTHAQKYFLKHGMPPAGPADGDGSDVAAPYASGTGGTADFVIPAGGGAIVKPVATLRHVALEPLHPLDSLGLLLRQDASTGAVVVEGFLPVPAADRRAAYGSSEMAPGAAPVVVTVPSLQSVDPSPIDKPASGPNAVARGSLAYEHRNVPLAPQGLQLGVAEESDLVRAGDIILGVTGVCVAGMPKPAVERAIAVARSVSPGGVVVLHLADAPIGGSLVDEATLQMAQAASQLLEGGAPAVDGVQRAILSAFTLATASTDFRTGMTQAQMAAAFQQRQAAAASAQAQAAAMAATAAAGGRGGMPLPGAGGAAYGGPGPSAAGAGAGAGSAGGGGVAQAHLAALQAHIAMQQQQQQQAQQMQFQGGGGGAPPPPQQQQQQAAALAMQAQYMAMQRAQQQQAAAAGGGGGAPPAAFPGGGVGFPPPAAAGQPQQ